MKRGHDGPPLVVAPLLARQQVHDLELVPVGVVAVEALRRPVVGLAHERACPEQVTASRGELVDRAHLPGEVVQPDRPARRTGRLGADREQAQVVVVVRPLGAEEGHEVAFAGDDLEAEQVAIEAACPVEVPYVQDGVVEPTHGDHRGESIHSAAMDLPAALLAAGLVGVGYLSGSIPVGVIVSRVAGGPDPRSVGSGRIGGTNIVRALGFGAGVLVGLLDVAKGAAPVLVARSVLTSDNPTVVSLTPYADVIQALTGLAAVVGSNRSIFLGLHGGRGVAAGIGAMLVIDWRAIAIAAPVFLAVVLATRYVSLGSLLGTAAAVVALLLFVLAGGTNPAYLVYGVTAGALIWLAHTDNIDRLLHGRERRFSFSRDPGA